MQLGLPERESEWAAEGKKLHLAIATGDRSGLDADQVALVDRCLEFALGLANEPNDVMLFEQPINVLSENGLLITSGTVDCVIVKANSQLIVIDWKFGYNKVSEVLRNIQLAAYCVGAMQCFKSDRCIGYVYQPRIKNVSLYEFTNPRSIIANINGIIERTTREKMVLNPSEEACRYCRARLNCPAFRVKFQKLSACRENFDFSNLSHLTALYESSRAVKSFINEIESEVRKVVETTGSCGRYVFQISEGSREIKDLNSLYAAVKDYLTQGEFNDICKVTIGKLESSLSERIAAEAKAKGETITKTEAMSRCRKIIAPLITHGAQTKKIVEQE